MKNLLLFCLFLVLACGTPPEQKKAPAPPPATTLPPPAPEAAKELIANSPEFSEYQFTKAAYTLPLKRSAMNEPARKAADALRKAGWIGFRGDDVVLAPKARTDKRWLVRANGVVDIVPLARKEVIDVTSVHGDKADFTWHWIPNEIGKVLALYDESPQRATATLLPIGTNWTVLRIQP